MHGAKVRGLKFLLEALGIGTLPFRGVRGGYSF